MEERDEDMNNRNEIHGFYDESQDRFDDVDRLRGRNRRQRNSHYNQNDNDVQETVDPDEEISAYRTNRTHEEEDKGGIMVIIVAVATLLFLLFIAFYCGKRFQEKKEQKKLPEFV